MRFIADWLNAVPLMVLAFLLAALATILLTPFVRRLATRYEIVDLPGDRRVNIAPTPRGGGLAIAATFVGVASLITLINAWLGLIPMPNSIGAPELIALLGGGALAAVIGAADDYFQLRARWQGLGQLLLALGTVAIGITVDFVNNPAGPGLLFLDGFAGVFTVFWFLGMINSINWIDGLDGLSSGVGLIAAVTLGIISLSVAVGQPFVAVLCFALAGALAGFLRWNFHPASIFMGTSGTMFVGYALAVLSILGTAKVAVAMLVLGVPIIDTFWIIVRRLAAHRSPFTPDRGHIHHRLLDLGLSHTQTVLLIYVLCVGLAVLAFVLSGTAQLYAFAAFVIVAGLVFYGLSRRSGGTVPPSERERRHGAHPVTPEARAVADGDPSGTDASRASATGAALRRPTPAAAHRGPTSERAFRPDVRPARPDGPGRDSPPVR